MAMPNRLRDLARLRIPARLRKLCRPIPAATLLLAVGAAPASAAASFGAMQLVNGVKVQSVFKGYDGAIYVTFSPAILAGCNSGQGGYLTSTWDEALAGSPPDPNAAPMQLSMLLTAKVTEAPLEVRYRLNTNGSGWDKCAIDAIWLQ